MQGPGTLRLKNSNTGLKKKSLGFSGTRILCQHSGGRARKTCECEASQGYLVKFHLNTNNLESPTLRTRYQNDPGLVYLNLLFLCRESFELLRLQEQRAHI